MSKAQEKPVDTAKPAPAPPPPSGKFDQLRAERLEIVGTIKQVIGRNAPPMLLQELAGIDWGRFPELLRLVHVSNVDKSAESGLRLYRWCIDSLPGDRDPELLAKLDTLLAKPEALETLVPILRGKGPLSTSELAAVQRAGIADVLPLLREVLVTL